MIKLINTIILIIIFSACSIINKQSSKDFYSPEFLKKIEKIKEEYRKGKTDNALKELKTIKDEGLNETEKAYRDDLIGVIYFSQNKFNDAEEYFIKSLSNSVKDQSLHEQINLNLSSTYFKKNKFEASYNLLAKIEFDKLPQNEKSKYYNLKLALATQLKKNNEAMEALVYILAPIKQFSDLEKTSRITTLWDLYSKFNESEKTRFLEIYEDENFSSVAYLGFKDAEKKLSVGDKDGARALLLWLDDRFPGHVELRKTLESIEKGKIQLIEFDAQSIGLILPFTGEKSSLSKRVLNGIELGLNEYFLKNKIVLHTRDSQSNGAIGALMTRELIDTKKVAMLIGGVTPEEAIDEYLEAKKRGIMFLSLSPVNLPKDDKDQFLIELSGSVESQISALLTDSVKRNFGTKVGLFFPDSSVGQSYVNEFFRLANMRGFEVKAAQSFKKDSVDFREPVEKILGLKFQKERKEEFDYLSSIYFHEKNGSIKRIQVLNPIVDYDWLFIPANPNEALQIIPLFSYYDATHIHYFGGPSWSIDQMVKNQPKIGSINFVGDDLIHLSDVYSKKYFEKHKSYPKVVETLSYDAIKVLDNLIHENQITDRDSLMEFISSGKKIAGLTGLWTLNDGIWIKNLLVMKISKGSFEEVK